MTDGSVAIKFRESRKAAVDIKPATGTETIASVKVTLKDASGLVVVDNVSIVQGVNGGWTTAADPDPVAWYVLAPSVLGLTANSCYALAFLITDSLGAVYEPVLLVVVLADGG